MGAEDGMLGTCLLYPCDSTSSVFTPFFPLEEERNTKKRIGLYKCSEQYKHPDFAQLYTEIPVMWVLGTELCPLEAYRLKL